jgi:tetratricopeptide (TPR) repeat protein
MAFCRNLSSILAAGILLAAVSTARAEWLEAKSKHFTVVGDVSEQFLQRRTARLERFDAALRKLFPAMADTNLPVMLVDSPADVRRLLGAPNGSIGAFFSPSPMGVFAVAPVRISEGFDVETVMFHEYVHHVFAGMFDAPLPRWVNEGFAELFAYTKVVDNGDVTFGVSSDRNYSLNRTDRWDVERLLVSDVEPISRFDADQVYAKGWLAMHYLVFSGNRQGQLGTFTELLKRGKSQREAALQAFGDLSKLESDLEYYRGRRMLPTKVLSKSQIGDIGSITIRRLSEAEAAIMPMRLQSMVGVSPVTAPVVVARAEPIAARYPADPLVQRAFAEMQYDVRNYDGADQAIDRALAANPEYVDALAYKGMLVGARARREGKPELWRESRQLIVKANRLAPDKALPLILFYDSYEAEGVAPPKNAVDGLKRAIVLQPSYDDLRLKLALNLIASGEPAKAREELALAAFAPHLETDNPMAKLVREIDNGLKGEALSAKVIELKLAGSNLMIESRPPDEEAKKPD